MNTPYDQGRRAAQKGGDLTDNPYQNEQRAAEWEDGFYSFEPKQKIKKGRPEWR